MAKWQMRKQLLKEAENIWFDNIKVKQTNRALNTVLRGDQGKLIKKSNLFSWFKVLQWI